MPAEKSIPATRTVRLRIASSANSGKLAALEATVAEWDQAVAFYTELFLGHPGVFAETKRVVVRQGPHAAQHGPKGADGADAGGAASAEAPAWAVGRAVAHPCPARRRVVAAPAV